MSLSLALPHSGPRLVANARVDAGPSAAEIETDGSRLLNASVDDVLGLGNDARVKDAAIAAVKKFGVEVSRASTLVAQLESRLAARLKTDAASIIDSVGPVLRALEQAEAVRFVDARLARRLGLSGTLFGSPEQLSERLGGQPQGERIIIVDGTPPFEGDLAPLPRLLEIASRLNVPVVLIDSVGPGALGATGLGVLDHYELLGQVDLLVATLGPAAVVVAGVRAVVDAFLPALPTRVSAASLGSLARRLELIESEAHRRARALDLAQTLHDALRMRSFDTGPSVTPVVPVWLGDEGLTDVWLRHLAENGIFCRGLLDGPRSRLIFSLPATCSEAQVGQLIGALEKTARRLGPAPALEGDAPRTVTIARPGTFVSATPCHPRWLPSPDALAGSPLVNDGRSMRERLFDTVETLTWRVASGQSGQLRRLPGAEALRALVDRARSKG